MGSVSTPTLEHYDIAIIGGGIAGVTLALACEKYGIRYALFEARDSLAPADGASIGLQANGIRILDQLGVWEELEKHTIPVKRWRHFDEKGEVMCKSDAFSYYESRFGYGSTCIDRRQLLAIMSRTVQGGAANNLIKLSCRVTSFKEDEEKVTVTTLDGTAITADLLVGADGVRSSVRKHIDSLQPGTPISSDDYMSTRFACVYGISPPMEGIIAGDCFSVYREKASALSFTGKDGVVFWFVFEDLGETIPLSKSPRYKASDADEICKTVAHLQVAPGVKFGDIIAKRTACMKTALEEGVAQVWHSDRAVIVGDAAHKMVPNAAQGGNQAMESVALLLNELEKVRTTGKISSEQLKLALSRYSDQRKPRASKIQKMAGMICRTQMMPHGEATSAAYQELPRLTDADWLFRGYMGFLGAPALAGIPLTEAGKFYDKSMSSFQEKFVTHKFSNAELVGMS